MTQQPTTLCNQGCGPVRVKKDGTLFKHGTPTCEGKPAVILAEAQPGRPPAPAEVSHWQAQAREAVARHMELEQHPASSAPVTFTGMLPSPETKLQEAEAQADAMFPEPDPFDTPASVPVQVNVSGQPDPERDHMGRYLVHDPELGDYRRHKNGNRKGITRTTTFVKAASNNAAISDWKCRNVLIGASLRPDLVRKAHGLTHETGKPELMSLCAQLETAAGAKVSADEGTFIHSFTEEMDAGLKTWHDAPKAYQDILKLYAETLEAAGLEPVPGLIERTVFISEFGGVAGTFDRVLYHRASGTYRIADVKTGKTLEYGMNEIQAQLWTYAHGINQHGVWDWNEKQWVIPVHPPGGRVTVSELEGIIIWMPVQGENQGTVNLKRADLAEGLEHAELCHATRTQNKPTIRDWVPPMPEPAEPTGVIDWSKIDPTPWEVLFSGVRTKAEAGALWERARAAGKSPAELRALCALADESLGRG